MIVTGNTANPSTFSKNTADSNGGAIAWEPGVNSALTLTNITFALNSASNIGGGVYANVGGTYGGGAISLGTVNETISGCTFSENSAEGNGGGFYVLQNTSQNGSIKLNLNNSTFSGNQASGNGGGIAVYLTASNAPANNAATLDSLTVSNNGASSNGGGLWTDPNSNTTLSLKNSIIANNRLAQNQPLQGPDLFGTVTSLGTNLIRITDGSGTTQWIEPGPNVKNPDITGTSNNPQDAGLDPNGLQNNGGPTQTIQLLTGVNGSAGYQKGATTLTQDQRGFTRNKPTSIGAYDPDGVEKKASNEGLNSSINPSLVGQSVTFTATVSGSSGTPTGTVTFEDNSIMLGTATLDVNGNASLSTSELADGIHDITANYSGDDTYEASSAALTQVVNPQSSSTSVTSSLNPSLSGQSVIFTATVSGSSGTPTGTVTFDDGTTVLGTGTLDGNGNATLTTSALALGSHNITAIYGGDSNYTGSSGALTQVVTQGITSSTSVTSSLNPSLAGQSVTFAATVSGSSGTPTGTVTFEDGTTVLGTGILDANGDASFTTSALAAGSHNITANYGGDANYGSSSAALTQVVTAVSSTSLTSSLNPSTAGQSVTFAAAVSGNNGTPTGTVTFEDGTTVLGTATLDSNGDASFTTSALAAGSHNITANYGGDANYASSSTALTQTVNALTSSTSLTSSLNPALAGQSITFAATVSGTSGTPTGTVTFEDGSTVLGTGTLDGNGNAGFSTSALAVGSHNITANYGGDGTYSASSAALTQVVNQNATTTAVTSSCNPALAGQPVTFTAAVSGNNGTPTGTVTFKDGSTVLGTGTLNGSDNATFTTSALALGSHNITAVYGGDSNFSGSSGALTQVISQENSSSTSLTSSLNPAQSGQAVTFTAKVMAAGTPTGTVSFMDGSTVLGTVSLSQVNGQAQAAFTTSTLSLGSHEISAVYSGDATYGDSAACLTETINKSMTSTTLSSSSSTSLSGQPVTFTASLTAGMGMGAPAPTGSVTFLDGTTVLGSGTLSLVNTQYEATFTTSTLSPGIHDIIAVYSGDGSYAASSSALTQTVSKGFTSVGVSSSINPSQPNQTVTFTAQILAAGGMGAPTPTGSVSFFNGTSVLGSGGISLVNGMYEATFSTAFGSGSYHITAIYSGDGSYAASSGSFTQTVGQTSLRTSSTSLSSSAFTAVPGQSVTITATVSGTSPSPTGSVTFMDGTTVLGTGTLSVVNGQAQATYTTSTLASGGHDITGIYSGNGTYAGSGSMLMQTVSPATTSTSVSSSSSTSQPGQAVTFTATVTSMAGGSPSGTVTFLDGTTVLGSGTLALVNGQEQATFTTALLTAGSHDITAVYNGDSTHAVSASSRTQTVSQAATSIALTSNANPSPSGQPVTFTATLSASGTPTGSVTFMDGTTILGTGTLSVVNGHDRATFTTAALGLGAHTILAIYSGDSTFADSGTSLQQTIN